MFDSRQPIVYGAFAPMDDSIPHFFNYVKHIKRCGFVQIAQKSAILKRLQSCNLLVFGVFCQKMSKELSNPPKLQIQPSAKPSTIYGIPQEYYTYNILLKMHKA